jgi:hypothetical protein
MKWKWKWKNKAWKVATLVVALPLLVAISPELVAIGAFVQIMGLELLLALFEVQLIALVTYAYRDQIKPLLVMLHNLFTKIDSNYFVPSLQRVSQYPALLLHAIPGLVSIYWLFLVII